MNQLLHVSSAAVKETDDGNVSTITLGAVSANAAELIPLVGEEVILRTPGQQGRSFHGSLTALLVKDSKTGPEVTLKVTGATDLNGLVGTNVTVEAAQMALPVGTAMFEGTITKEPTMTTVGSVAGASDPQKETMGESVIVPAVRRELAKEEAAPAVGKATNADPADGRHAATSGVTLDDLENF